MRLRLFPAERVELHFRVIGSHMIVEPWFLDLLSGQYVYVGIITGAQGCNQLLAEASRYVIFYKRN